MMVKRYMLTGMPFDEIVKRMDPFDRNYLESDLTIVRFPHRNSKQNWYYILATSLKADEFIVSISGDFIDTMNLDGFCHQVYKDECCDVLWGAPSNFKLLIEQLA